MDKPKPSWIAPDGRVRRIEDIDPLYKVEDRPLWFHTAGRQQTASGYGLKLTSSRVVHFYQKGNHVRLTRRVYVTIFSNAGTSWITYKGDLYVVD